MVNEVFRRSYVASFTDPEMLDQDPGSADRKMREVGEVGKVGDELLVVASFVPIEIVSTTGLKNGPESTDVCWLKKGLITMRTKESCSL